MDINVKDKINYYSVTVQKNNNLSENEVPIEEASNENSNMPDYSNADYLTQLYSEMDASFNFDDVFFNSIPTATDEYNRITNVSVNENAIIVNGEVQFADTIDTIKAAMDSNAGTKQEETSVRLEYIGDMEYNHKLIKDIYNYAEQKSKET